MTTEYLKSLGWELCDCVNNRQFWEYKNYCCIARHLYDDKVYYVYNKSIRYDCEITEEYLKEFTNLLNKYSIIEDNLDKYSALDYINIIREIDNFFKKLLKS